tara:strand:- start:1059 stop:2408 length:1350 start_codon:yes stop_codon:yes gene_type:complete
MINWKNKVIYQIYPRSFQDTSGNGIGDLNGISSKADYISDLGVDYIWISPFFESPQKDFGYDVSNYRKVDKIFGSNEDFKKLIDVFHKRNIGVITDLVLSHTSDEHQWFKESRSSKTNKYKDWYVWQDGTPDTTPNNWLSVFGGSSWKWDRTREQYYLHNFLESQPDLNFHNPEVQEQMLSEIKFWLDFGVDGFRFDVINFLYHDKELRNNPPKHPNLVRPLGFNKDNPYGLQVHKFDNTQPETLEYLSRIRTMLDKYNAISVGEIVAENPLEIIGEYANDKRLHMAYCFEFLSEDFDFMQTDKIVKDFFQNNPRSWPCWSYSNHDSKRIASRVSKDPKDIMKKLLELEGNICIYQGEELGLKETNVAFKDLQDPFGKNFWPEFKGRDGCRTPMPWNSNKNLGFSSSVPWLPANNEYLRCSVEKQIEDKNSMLNYTKDLISKRSKGIAT